MRAKEHKYSKRFNIYLDLKNGHSTVWNNGGLGFTQEEVDNLIRIRLTNNGRVEKYTVKAMKDSIITREA